MRTYITPYRPPSPQTVDPLLTLLPTTITTTTTAPAATRSKVPSSPKSPVTKFAAHFANFHIPFLTHHHAHDGKSPPKSPMEQLPPPMLSSEEILEAKKAGASVFGTVKSDWAEEIERQLKLESSEEEGDGDEEMEGDTDGELEEEPVAGKEGRILEWVELESDSETGLPERFKNPFRFSSPDEISTSRRKRRRSIEVQKAEEEVWNEGLRDWNRRRELWTGMKREKNGEWVKAPKCKSRFADNKLTHQVCPANYPRIYRNLISNPATNSSATVPINLSHVVAAMVDGWKSEGQWPPKIGPIEPNFARRRPSAAVPERKKSAEEGAGFSVLRITRSKEERKSSDGGALERKNSGDGVVERVRRAFSPKMS